MIEKIFKMLISIWACIVAVAGFFFFGMAIDCFSIKYLLKGFVCIICGGFCTYLYENM